MSSKSKSNVIVTDNNILANKILNDVNKKEAKFSKKMKENAEKKIENLLEVAATGSKKLKYKEIQFCKYYIENNGNASLAAVKAGYSKIQPPANANHLLKRPHIQELIKNLLIEKMAADEVTYNWKMVKLKDTIEVIEQKLKEDEGLNSAALASALSRLISEVNKMQGHYAPVKQQSTHTINIYEKRIDDLIEQNWQDC